MHRTPTLVPSRPRAFLAPRRRRDRRGSAGRFLSPALRGAFAPALALATSLAAHGSLAGQEPGSLRGLAGPGHPVCRAWLHGWAEGGADPGLATFGALAAGAYGEPGASEGLAAARLGERLALGVDSRGGSGPRRAGAIVSGSESGGYAYPGPGAGEDRPAALRVRGELARGRLVAAADVAAAEGDFYVRVLALGVKAGPVAALAGALTLRSGPGCEGGLVLGAPRLAEAWGLELRQGEARLLPWVGSFQVAVQLGVLLEAGPGNRWPLFHAMRIELRPHEDWTVGLNRAVIFGGDGTGVPVTLRSMALMLIGITNDPEKSSDFENQVASLDVRWRGRLAGAPLLVTAEYGADDSGLAFLRVPGARLDAEVALSGRRGWVGLAGTWLAGRRAGHPPWYQHGALAWGWTDRGRPLGSPFGGQAKALLATYRGEWASLALESAAGVVDRGPDNLFAPDLEGAGAHASSAVLWMPGPWEVSLSASADLAGARVTRWSVSILRRLARRPTPGQDVAGGDMDGGPGSPVRDAG